jgi:predicted AAA+ superfamily ATPase
MSIPSDLAAILEDLNPWWKAPGARKALAWPVRRSVHARLLDRLARPEEWRAQVLLGPRQVGKTTLLRQLADDLLDHGWPALHLTYFDFEDYRLGRQVKPEEVGELRPAGADPDRPQVLLLDEVHQLPRWDRWLRHAVDNRIGRIVVTDSAASLLREGGRESGLGRWDEILLEGLTFQEFAALTAKRGATGDDASTGSPPPAAPIADPELVERFLALGGFPAHATSDDFPLVRERLRSDIVDRAIRRDLGDRVDDPEPVRRLLVYLVQQSGGEQNAADRAADLDVDPRTVAKWMEMLQDTFLISALRRGSTSAKATAQLRGRPKLYAGDHGLVAAFSAAPPSDSEVRGKLFEAVVYRHLREVARAQGGDLHYLRWGDGYEVDFILDMGEQRFAIEVTQAVQPKAAKRAKLAQAADRAGAQRAVLVHGGLADGVVEGVVFVPVSRFLAGPWPALLGEGP